MNKDDPSWQQKWDNATNEEKEDARRQFMVGKFTGWQQYSWLLINLLPCTLFTCIFLRFVFLRQKKVERQAQDYQHELNEAQNPVQGLLAGMVPALELGEYKFKGIKKPNQTVTLEFKDLGLVLKSGRPVLKGVTGNFQAGNLSAVMGASGAGKTTFMNVLCGKGTYGTMSGEVFVNSQPLDMGQLQSIMGFVPQDDIVHEKLTVRENLLFSALLRNSRETKYSEIQDIVNDVLTVLQIGHIQLSIVGGAEDRGISGGQRKRVNIGLELAATPTLLFLDEPTSGLDATSSFAIIKSLKKMSELGMTIIMVIHQPRYSLFKLFDSVLLLGKGGQTVYLGGSEEAKAYFEKAGFQMPQNENPADWFMDVLSGEVQNEKHANFKLQQLFDLWEQEMPTKQEGAREAMKSRSKSSVYSVDAKRLDIENALQDAWQAINAGNGLDRDEFTRLVEYCTGVRHQGTGPLDEIWAYMGQMHGSDKVEFSYSEFVDSMYELWVRDPGAANGGKSAVAENASVGDRLLDAVDQAIEVVIDPAMKVAQNIPNVLGRSSSSKEASQPDVQRTFTVADMKRKTPGALRQCQILSLRRLLQVFRFMPRRIMDLTIITACALILAVQHKDKTGEPPNIILFHLAICLLIPVNCISCFGAERPMFWRERSHGLIGWSYCAARVVIDSIDVFTQTIWYGTVYYLVAQPYLPFIYFLEPILLLAFVCSGWGYCISCVVPPTSATLTTVVLMLVLNGALGDPGKMMDYIDGSFMEVLVAICPTRWSVQMAIICWYGGFEVDPDLLGDRHVQAVNMYRSSALDMGQEIKDLSMAAQRNETRLDDIGDTYWNSAVIVLLIEGFLLRILTIPLLCFRNRDKQV